MHDPMTIAKDLLAGRLPAGCPRFGAGILFATRDDSGKCQILVGKKRRSDNPLKVMAGKGGYWFHDCWSIPFGTLEHKRDEAFYQCAIREAAEETVAGFREGQAWTEARDAFDAIFGLPSIAQRIQEAPGYRSSPLPGMEFWTFLVRLPAKPGDWPDWRHGEFDPDSFTWHDRWDLESLRYREQQFPLHFGTTEALEFFRAYLNDHSKS